MLDNNRAIGQNVRDAGGEGAHTPSESEPWTTYISPCTDNNWPVTLAMPSFGNISGMCNIRGVMHVLRR